MNLLINIDVPDLAAAEALYTAAFGLTPARRFGDAGVELLGAAAPFYLPSQAQGRPATGHATRTYDRHWTAIHLDVVVDDLDSALDRATRAGLHPETDIRTHDWGRIVQLADPFGHGWCLLQFTGRGYDAIATS